MEKVFTKLSDPIAKIATGLGNFIDKVDASKVSVNQIAGVFEKALPVVAAFTAFVGVKAGKEIFQALPIFQGLFKMMNAGVVAFIVFAATSTQVRDAVVRLGASLAPLGAPLMKIAQIMNNVLALAVGVVAKAINGLASVIQRITSFFQSNARATQILVIALTGIATAVGLATIAFYAHAAALKIVTFTQALLQVATTLLSGAQLASIASTNGLTASMLRLNAVISR